MLYPQTIACEEQISIPCSSSTVTAGDRPMMSGVVKTIDPQGTGGLIVGYLTARIPWEEFWQNEKVGWGDIRSRKELYYWRNPVLSCDEVEFKPIYYEKRKHSQVSSWRWKWHWLARWGCDWNQAVSGPEALHSAVRSELSISLSNTYSTKPYLITISLCFSFYFHHNL